MLTRWVITAVIVVLAVALAIARRKLARASGVLSGVLLVLGFAAVVWTPRLWRDGIILFGSFAVFASTWGFWGAVFTTALIGVVMYLMPGGGTVVLCGVVGLVSIAVGFDMRELRARIDRARRLTPGERPSGDIAMSGISQAMGAPLAPLARAGACVWWELTVGPVKQRSDAPFLIKTRAGTGVIHPADVKMELFREVLTLSPDEVHAVKAAAGGEVAGPAPTASGAGASAAPEQVRSNPPQPRGTLAFIPVASALFVIGAPDWEPSPSAEVSYREAPLVPVFRAGKDRPVTVADRDQVEVRGDTVWSLVAWVSWGAVSGVIAALQAIGTI